MLYRTHLIRLLKAFHRYFIVLYVSDLNAEELIKFKLSKRGEGEGGEPKHCVSFVYSYAL